jgi:N-ethylmaleimide reductase
MLFDKFSASSLQLANRMVMAPLTRSRATPQHTPNALMAKYYGQRATAGLIITEGTSPSPDGLGYPRIPGLYDAAQADAWKATTTAVHAQGGRIFVQFMHCGRVAHVANLPAGAEVLGPGTAVCPGEMYTDTLGMQPHSPPRAMTEADIAQAVKEHVAAAKLALDAGFDGVELHGANGYLIEQFLNPLGNLRTDGYGGSIERRNRLALEIARATVAAIGRDRVGIRLSPYGVFNGTGAFPEVQAQYLTLVHSLSALGPALPAPGRSLVHGRAAGARRFQAQAARWLRRAVHPLRWFRPRPCRTGLARQARRSDRLRAAVPGQSGSRGADAQGRPAQRPGRGHFLRARCQGLHRLSGPGGLIHA